MSLILANNDFVNKTLINTDSGVEMVASDLQYIDFGNPAKLSDLTGSFSVSMNVMITGDGIGDGSSRGIFGNYDTSPGFYSISGLRIFYNNIASTIGFIIHSGSTLYGIASPAISQNTMYNLTCVYNPSGYIRIYLGGTLVSENTTSIPASINTPTKNYLVGSHYASGVIQQYSDIIVNNIVVYDKALTDFEVFHHVYLHGGEVRSPLHENIIFHAPLTEKFIHKVVAGDEAINRGLVIGDKMATDISMRYNYVKNPVIEASHGKFVNFNDDSIGADTNQNISSIKGFYDNSEYRSIGKKYDSATKKWDEITNWTEFEYTQPFTVLVKIKLDNLGDSMRLLTTNDDNDVGFRLALVDNYFRMSLQSGSANFLSLSSLTVTSPGVYTAVYTHNGIINGTGNEWYVNGVNDTNVLINNLSGTIINGSSMAYVGRLDNAAVQNYYSDGGMYSLEILDSVKSLADIQEANAKGTFHGVGSTLDSEFLLSVNFNKESGQLNTKPNTPSYTIQAYEDVTAVTPVLGDGNYLESNTNLPKISQALLIEGEKYVSYPTLNLPTDTEDFTLSVSGWITDVNPVPLGATSHIEPAIMLGDKGSATTWNLGSRIQLSHQVVGGGVNKNKRMQPAYRPPSDTIAKSTNENQTKYFFTISIIKKGDRLKIFINGQQVEYSVIATTLNPYTFVDKLFRSGYTNWDDASNLSNMSQLYLSKMAYYKRSLDGWEIAKQYNNSLLANPTTYEGMQNDLEQYYQFQTGSIYKVGATYYCKNQADILKGTWVSGGINEAIIGSDGTAWTDAELINTNPTKIKNINSLK